MATLAIGIGATTAIFSIVDPALLRPLPFPDSEQLVDVRTRMTDGRVSTGLLSAAELAALNESHLPQESKRSRSMRRCRFSAFAGATEEEVTCIASLT
jgi:hypothetical protein